MKLRILSVDFHLEGKGIENHTFYETPSFSDYDAIIIDPRGISDLWVKKIAQSRDGSFVTYTTLDAGFGKTIQAFMASKKEEVKHLLSITKGVVICILRNQEHALRIHVSDRTQWSIDNYSWLSGLINFAPIRRPGKELNIINRLHPFSQYLNAFRDSIDFKAVLSPLHQNGAIPIACNKVRELIASEYPVEGGKIIFLPPLNNPNPQKVAGVLIDCLKGAFRWSVSSKKPAWISSYTLAGEGEIIEHIRKHDNEISRVEKGKEELRLKLNQLEMLKSLLYEQGKYGLEPAVRDAFKLLGFNIVAPEEYEEEYDLFAKEDDLIVIGEIEGSEAQVDIKKYRQLLDYVDHEETSNGNAVKGILIGNGFIGEKPEERKEQFTDAAIRGCRNRRFCRITTYELFKAVQVVLSGTIPKEKIKEHILKCEDEFKLSMILDREGVFCPN